MRFTFIVSLAAILFLAACTSEIPSEEQTINDINGLQPNQRLVCDGENQQLDGLQCVCDSGFKVCNKVCVPEAQCCSNSDCTSGVCSEGVCTNPCQDKLCKINEVCDSNTGACSCKPGTKYCAKQQTCIANNQCCDNADCNKDRAGRRCVDIVTSVNICVNDGQFCKWARQDKPAQLALGEKGFEVYIDELYQDSSVDVTVNGNLFEHQSVPSTVSVGADKVSFEEVKLTGGQCQEYS